MSADEMDEIVLSEEMLEKELDAQLAAMDSDSDANDDFFVSEEETSSADPVLAPENSVSEAWTEFRSTISRSDAFISQIKTTTDEASSWCAKVQSTTTTTKSNEIVAPSKARDVSPANEKESLSSSSSDAVSSKNHDEPDVPLRNIAWIAMERKKVEDKYEEEQCRIQEDCAQRTKQLEAERAQEEKRREEQRKRELERSRREREMLEQIENERKQWEHRERERLARMLRDKHDRELAAQRRALQVATQTAAKAAHRCADAAARSVRVAIARIEEHRTRQRLECVRTCASVAVNAADAANRFAHDAVVLIETHRAEQRRLSLRTCASVAFGAAEAARRSVQIAVSHIEERLIEIHRTSRRLECVRICAVNAATAAEAARRSVRRAFASVEEIRAKKRLEYVRTCAFAAVSAAEAARSFAHRALTDIAECHAKQQIDCVRICAFVAASAGRCASRSVQNAFARIEERRTQMRLERVRTCVSVASAAANAACRICKRASLRVETCRTKLRMEEECRKRRSDCVRIAAAAVAAATTSASDAASQISRAKSSTTTRYRNTRVTVFELRQMSEKGKSLSRAIVALQSLFRGRRVRGRVRKARQMKAFEDVEDDDECEYEAIDIDAFLANPEMSESENEEDRYHDEMVEDGFDRGVDRVEYETKRTIAWGDVKSEDTVGETRAGDDEPQHVESLRRDRRTVDSRRSVTSDLERRQNAREDVERIVGEWGIEANSSTAKLFLKRRKRLLRGKKKKDRKRERRMRARRAVHRRLQQSKVPPLSESKRISRVRGRSPHLVRVKRRDVSPIERSRRSKPSSAAREEAFSKRSYDARVRTPMTNRSWGGSERKFAATEGREMLSRFLAETTAIKSRLLGNASAFFDDEPRSRSKRTVPIGNFLPEIGSAPPTSRSR